MLVAGEFTEKHLTLIPDSLDVLERVNCYWKCISEQQPGLSLREPQVGSETRVYDPLHKY